MRSYLRWFLTALLQQTVQRASGEDCGLMAGINKGCDNASCARLRAHIMQGAVMRPARRLSELALMVEVPL
jgi:hypothetical protein